MRNSDHMFTFHQVRCQRRSNQNTHSKYGNMMPSSPSSSAKRIFSRQCPFSLQYVEISVPNEYLHNFTKQTFLKLISCRLPKELNTIISKVCNNYIPLWRQSEAMWVIQLTVTITLSTKFRDKTSLVGKDLNPMIISVGDNNVSVVTHGYASGAH